MKRAQSETIALTYNPNNLIQVIKKGDLSSVQSYMTNDKSWLECILVTEGSKKGCKALHIAALFDQDEIVRYLLDLGANIECVDNTGWTPFLYASYNCNKKATELLLLKKAKHLVKDSTGDTFLHKLAKAGKIEFLNWLNTNFPRIISSIIREDNTKWNNANKPLFYALGNQQFEFAFRLFELGTNLEQINEERMTVLHFLAMYGKSDHIQSFAKLYPQTFKYDLLNKTDDFNNTPLHYALYNDIKTTELLLTMGANPAAFSQAYKNILTIAVIYGHIDFLKKHIDNKNIAWNVSDYHGMTLLHHAAARQDPEILEFLLSLPKIRPLINEKDFFARIPLQVAVEKKCDAAIKLLGGDLEILKKSPSYGYERPIISQSHIMPQCLEYLKLNKRDTTSYNPEGHCKGLESTAGCDDADINSTLDDYFNKLNIISSWDRSKQSLTDQKSLIFLKEKYDDLSDLFDQFTDSVFSFQKSQESIINRPERLVVLRNKMEEKKKATVKIETFFQNIYSCSISKQSYTASVFEEYIRIFQKTPMTLQIEFSRKTHATRLFIENGTLRYVEPNQKHQFAPFHDVDKFIKCYFRYKFHFLGLDSSKAKPEFLVYSIKRPSLKKDQSFNYFKDTQLPNNAAEDRAFQRQSAHGLTFLHITVLTNSFDNLRKFVKKSFIKLDRTNKAGESALDWVFTHQRQTCLKIIVENLHEDNLSTLIKECIKSYDLKNLKLLFSARTIKHDFKIGNETMLTYALKNINYQYKNHKDVAHWLIKNKIALDVPNNFHEYPIFLANGLGSEFTQIIINNSTDLLICNEKGENLLHWAVKVCELERVKLLLNKGIDVNHKDNDGNTVLHKLVQTVCYGHPEKNQRRKLIFDEIIKQKDLNINCVNKRGKTPIEDPCYFWQWEKVQILLNRGAHANSDIQTQAGYPLLLAVILQKEWKLLNTLFMQKNFDASKPVKGNLYAIHYLAVYFCDECKPCVDKLLSQVDINSKTKNELSALDIAVLNHNASGAAYFIDKGLTTLDSRIRPTVLKWKEKGKHDDIVKLLETHNIDLSQPKIVKQEDATKTVKLSEAKQTLFQNNDNPTPKDTSSDDTGFSWEQCVLF